MRYSDTEYEPYPPYDEFAVCPKCGCQSVGAEYFSGAHFLAVRRGPDGGLLQYLRRQCNNCGYTWREECLDTVHR